MDSLSFEGFHAQLDCKFTYGNCREKPSTIYFLLATCNVRSVVIPEIFAKTQGSDYWQLIQ